MFIKTDFSADGCIAVTHEVFVQSFPGKLGKEDHHQTDAEQAEPHGASFIGGGGVHCGAEDRDQTCYNSCHCSLWGI